MGGTKLSFTDSVHHVHVEAAQPSRTPQYSGGRCAQNVTSSPFRCIRSMNNPHRLAAVEGRCTFGWLIVGPQRPPRSQRTPPRPLDGRRAPTQELYCVGTAGKNPSMPGLGPQESGPGRAGYYGKAWAWAAGEGGGEGEGIKGLGCPHQSRPRVPSGNPRPSSLTGPFRASSFAIHAFDAASFQWRCCWADRERIFGLCVRLDGRPRAVHIRVLYIRIVRRVRSTTPTKYV